MDVAADARAVTDAAIGLLVDAGLTVGDGVAYTDDDPSAPLTPPYAIVYPVSAVTSGPNASPDADADRTVQVQGIGVSRAQAQWVADKAMQALCGAPHRSVVIEGRALTGAIRHAGSSGVRRDDATAKPHLFYAVDRYVFPTTPGGS